MITDIAWIDYDVHIVSGDFLTVNDVDCMKQNILRRLTTPRGSIFYDTSFGSELWKYIRAREAPLKFIENHVERVLTECDEINPGNISVQAFKNGESLFIGCEIELLATGTVESIYLDISTNGVQAGFQ